MGVVSVGIVLRTCPGKVVSRGMPGYRHGIALEKSGHPKQHVGLQFKTLSLMCNSPVWGGSYLPEIFLHSGVTGPIIPPAGVYPGMLWPRPIYTLGYIMANSNSYP